MPASKKHPREPISPHPADPRDRELVSQGEHDVPDRKYPGDYEPCDGPPAPPRKRTGVKDRNA